MNPYLTIVLVILVGSCLLRILLATLTVKWLSPELPEEFTGRYEPAKYARAQSYARERTMFGVVREAFFTLFAAILILTGAFGRVDVAARSFGFGSVITGLIYAAILGVVLFLVSLPFTIYSTFVIEERYGFNRTTLRTFMLDLFKGILLSLLLGAPVLACVIWFFESTGGWAWLWCWALLTVFQLVVAFLAPVLIMPLFNKFVPLEESPLKQRILEYLDRQNFRIKGLYSMDGSKRSSKSNAFFTGFGRFRRIALFDTLMERHTEDEIVAVLAHEVGHFKKRHVLKLMVVSILSSGLMFALLSFVIGNTALFHAFGVEKLSVYVGLVLFGFFYGPIDLVISIWGNVISRKYEFEADRFAVETTRKGEEMIETLKKLAMDNMSNLTPHPLVVFMEYSHPPVIERIRAIKKLR